MRSGLNEREEPWILMPGPMSKWVLTGQAYKDNDHIVLRENAKEMAAGFCESW